MLDLMGSGYVIDHCIAAINADRRRQTFEVYVTDSLYVMLKYINRGKDVLDRYWDMINPKPKDERSGAEIAADIIKRHGLKEVK